jgi:ribosomal protein S18 acetylase RimI-like enzyme
MDRRNENPPANCRFLNENDIFALHQTFLDAFSDYLITFQLTPGQLERHIILNAVDLNRSVGCFSGEKMVAFTMNGFGTWNGKSTIYDAGTGVVPAFRRQGLSRKMFELMFPMCRELGIEQCLLEVITGNDKAVKLYENLGFHPTRTLLLLETKNLIKTTSGLGGGLEIREIKTPDWDLLLTFWDGDTSWQNSVEAIERSLDLKKILGAFIDGECVGYIAFSANLGRIAQLAVSKKFRNRGIGSALVLAVQSGATESESLQVINLDDSLVDVVRFFRNRGFDVLLSQYEMVKPL